MLFDIKNTLQNVADHDAKLAKAIDDYFDAQVAMIRAVKSASQRYTQGVSATGGNPTPETQACSQLAQSIGTLAEQSIAAITQSADAAASWLYINRRLATGLLLDAQKGGKHD